MHPKWHPIPYKRVPFQTQAKLGTCSIADSLCPRLLKTHWIRKPEVLLTSNGKTRKADVRLVQLRFSHREVSSQVQTQKWLLSHSGLMLIQEAHVQMKASLLHPCCFVYFLYYEEPLTLIH